MAMTRDAILNAKGFRKREVEIPEWNDTIFIRAFSSIDRGIIEAEMASIQGGNYDKYALVRAKVCVASICDENGNMLFTEADVEEIGKKDSAVIERIFNEAIDLNGYTDQDIEDLKKS